MAVQVDRGVWQECGLVVVGWEQEGVSVRASLVDYVSDKEYGRYIYIERGIPRYLSPR